MAPTQRLTQRKACAFCDRTFSKPAHLKRHQRSHTGERPYKCNLCSKRFSRSDVLIRHTKNHAENAMGGGDEVSVSSDHEPGDLDHQYPTNESTDYAITGNQSAESAERRGLQLAGQAAASPTSVDASRNDIHSFSTTFAQNAQIPQPLPGNIDHLTAIATEREHSVRNMNTTVCNNQSVLEVFSDIHHPVDLWNLNGSDHGAPRYGHEASYQNPSHSISSNFSANLDFLDSTSYLPVNETADMEELIQFQTHHFLPSGEEYARQDDSSVQALLQAWFNQVEDSSHALQQDPTAFDSTARLSEFFPNEQPTENERIRPFSGPEDRTRTDNMPKELFERVQQCWPTPSRNIVSMMPTLWQNAILKAEDNLFSNNQVAYKAHEKERPRGSRWGLDQTCRERLQLTLESQPSRSATSFQSPWDNASNGRSNEIVLPPADILDIGMDLYFRHFHPLVPFIHIPTFSLTSTPASMLLVMCLLGLASIKTREAKSVIQNAFAKVLAHVHAEIFPSLLPREKQMDLMTTLATTFMLICLAGITGEAEDRDQCQVLYVNAILIAQQRGLFDAKCSQILDEDMFAQVSDLDLRWKAWARVESTKRLIVCLIILDSWFAGLFHSSPNIRIDDLCFIMPCDRRLFQVKTASMWARLLESGHAIAMPLVDLSSEHASFPKLSSASSAFGLHGLLSAIRLRFSDAYYRLLSNRDNTEQKHLIPWEIFATDVRARRTISLLDNVLESYSIILQEVDPNCMMLWHNMNIMLCADLRIFELGAGRAGPFQARKALEDIRTWTDTPAARRACIHAGQMFKLMSHRRASDGTMLHSAIGLFISALVLGLYILKARPTMDSCYSEELGFDLLDDVDWKRVKDEGYARYDDLTDDPAINFIRKGGKIIFSGVEHDPGYTSARRILLDYAGLLEECMKWNGGRYSPILRIMSDALVDS